jgi:hypothetical protein
MSSACRAVRPPITSCPSLTLSVSNGSSHCFGCINVRSFLGSPLVIVGKRLKLVRNRLVSEKSLSFPDTPCLVVRSATSWSPHTFLWRVVQGDLKPGQPIAVTCPASSEAIDTRPGAKRGSPGVIPDETKLAFTNRAACGSARSGTFGVGHCRLLLALSSVFLDHPFHCRDDHPPFQRMHPKTIAISVSIGRR